MPPRLSEKNEASDSLSLLYLSFINLNKFQPQKLAQAFQSPAVIPLGHDLVMPKAQSVDLFGLLHFYSNLIFLTNSWKKGLACWRKRLYDWQK